LTTNGLNVGINTTTPAYTLDVSGSINFTGTLNSNGAPMTFTPAGINSSGNIAINATTANTPYTLDVNGPMQAAVYYSTITVGGTTTVTPAGFGVYYNVTAQGIYTLAFSASQASSNIGKYNVIRNNSGVTLSIALTGVTGITSPVTLSNAQSATFIVATTSTYALF
jgi:hypothetical protein